MKRLLAALAAALVLACAPGTAGAQDLNAIVAAEAAVIDAWNASPLVFRRTLFAAEASAFGVYEERPDATFRIGEPILVYAEPAGYAWRDNGDGSFSFGFDVDLLLKKPDGTIVAGKEDFQRLELSSHERNREFMLTITLNVDGAPAGDYVLEYRIRDIASAKSAIISLPLTIVE